MTEDAWLVCTDSQKMLKSLRGKVGDRKLRLLACGCCRQVWASLTLKPVRRAVEAAEQYADGAATDEELQQANEKGILAVTRTLHGNADRAVSDAAYAAKLHRMAFAVDTARPAPLRIGHFGGLGKDDVLRPCSPVLLRCLVGNPFRPSPFDRTWLAWKGGTIPKLAQAIYDERAFDRLPILADALEEAGCTDAAILTHCRQPGPHFRGCFVVDWVLEKG